MFAHLGRGRVNEERLIVDAGEPQRLLTSRISPGFLEVFGVAPVMGRAVTQDDTRTGAAPVGWLGHDYWQRAFGGRADVIGETLRVDGTLVTIVGVLPGWFYRDCAVWMPMMEPSAVMQTIRGSGTPTYGRLLRGLSLDDAQRRLTDMTTAPGQDGPVALRVELQSLYDDVVNAYRPAVHILVGAVAIVLLIACVNVAGLLLARGATRQGELAVRASMGAGRRRLVRQLLTESSIIAIAGGVGGIALASLILDGLVAVLPIRLPANAPPAINLTVLGFGLTLSMVVTLVFGLLPALRLSRVSLGPQLSRTARRHGTPLTRRGGQMLVAAQVALALVLLSGAGLMVRSLARASSIDVGFDPASFVTMEVFPIVTGESSHTTYFPELLDAIRALPGVQAAGAATLGPLSRSGSYTDATAGEYRHMVSTKSVTPGYFEAIGLTPVQGRLPDWDPSAPNPIVISDGAARALFPAQDAIGRQLQLQRQSHTVAAVVRDVRGKTALELDTQRPDVYLMLHRDSEEWSGRHGRLPTIIVRPDGSVPGLADALRRAAHAVGPPVIVERIRSGSDWFGDNLEYTRHRTVLLGLIGGLGLTLTLVGVFSITAYAVARRTHEVGVRMAFGARPTDVVRRMVGDTAWPIVIGAVGGLAGAYYAARFIESFLYDTPPREPVTFAIVAAVMVAIALLAAWIPARRAAKVDPVVALRAE